MDDPRGSSTNYVFQSQSYSQTSYPNIETCNKSKGKSVDTVEKASWDTKTTMIFIRLCVDELRAGNRPGKYFNKTGWDRLVKNFFNATQRDYNRIQLKNRWDALKKEFGIWTKLLHNETGIGWNSEKGTVEASPEWWQQKLQVVPEAAKFRERGPIMLKEQEILFADVVANGNSAYTPSSGLVPPHMENEESNDYPNNHGDESDNVSRPNTNVNQSTTNYINLDDQGNRAKRCKGFTAPIQHKKAKKVSSAEKLAKTLERMTDLIESRSAPTPTHESQFTIEACLDILEKMPEIEEGGKLWMYATRLFLKPPIRELFIKMKKDQFRVKWLEEQMEEDSARKASRRYSG